MRKVTWEEALARNDPPSPPSRPARNVKTPPPGKPRGWPLRQLLGVLALVAGGVVVMTGFMNMPDASTCQFINDIVTSTGVGQACTTTPPAGYFVVAGILALVGILLILAPKLGES